MVYNQVIQEDFIVAHELPSTVPEEEYKQETNMYWNTVIPGNINIGGRSSTPYRVECTSNRRTDHTS